MSKKIFGIASAALAGPFMALAMSAATPADAGVTPNQPECSNGCGNDNHGGGNDNHGGGNDNHQQPPKDQGDITVGQGQDQSIGNITVGQGQDQSLTNTMGQGQDQKQGQTQGQGQDQQLNNNNIIKPEQTTIVSSEGGAGGHSDASSASSSNATVGNLTTGPSTSSATSGPSNSNANGTVNVDNHQVYKQAANGSTVITYTSGQCGSGWGFSLGIVEATGGISRSGQDKFCLSQRAADKLIEAGIQKGDSFMVAGGIAALREMFAAIDEGMNVVIENARKDCSTTLVSPIFLTQSKYKDGTDIDYCGLKAVVVAPVIADAAFDRVLASQGAPIQIDIDIDNSATAPAKRRSHVTKHVSPAPAAPTGGSCSVEKAEIADLKQQLAVAKAHAPACTPKP